MKIVVGSRNGAKVAACEAVLKEAFGDIDLLEVDADSGITSMPMDNNTSVKGAKNRAIDAMNQAPGADFAVGLEGGTYYGPDNKMFLVGWVAVLDKQGNFGLGHSGGVVLPDGIAKVLENGQELGPLTQEMFKDDKNEIRHTLGTTGILTKGLYPRNREFEDALRNALAPFLTPEHYKIKFDKQI